MTPQQEVDLLRAAICVACSDGKTTTAEQKLIDKLAGNVGVGSASVNAMIDRAYRDPEFYHSQFEVLKADPKQSLATLIHMALIDGQVDQAEIKVLRGLAGQLDIPEKTFDELMQSVSTLMNEHRQA